MRWHSGNGDVGLIRKSDEEQRKNIKLSIIMVKMKDDGLILNQKEPNLEHELDNLNRRCCDHLKRQVLLAEGASDIPGPRLPCSCCVSVLQKYRG